MYEFFNLQALQESYEESNQAKWGALKRLSATIFAKRKSQAARIRFRLPFNCRHNYRWRIFRPYVAAKDLAFRTCANTLICNHTLPSSHFDMPKRAMQIVLFLTRQWWIKDWVGHRVQPYLTCALSSELILSIWKHDYLC